MEKRVSQVFSAVAVVLLVAGLAVGVGLVKLKSGGIKSTAAAPTPKIFLVADSGASQPYVGVKVMVDVVDQRSGQVRAVVVFDRMKVKLASEIEIRNGMMVQELTDAVAANDQGRAVIEVAGEATGLFELAKLEFKPASEKPNDMTSVVVDRLESRLEDAAKNDLAFSTSGGVSLRLNSGAEAISVAGEESVDASGRRRVVMYPTGDTYVNADKPGENYGKSTLLRVDRTPEMTSIIKFSLDRVEKNMVSGARLRFRVAERDGAGSKDGAQVVSVKDYVWDQNVITYTSLPQSEDLIGELESANSGEWREVIVPGERIASASGGIAFAVKARGEDEMVFYSRENGENRPELVIEY